MIEEENEFSKLTALKHVAVVIFLTMVLGAIMAGMNLFANSQQAGEAIGRNVLWLAAATWVASYAAQKKKQILLFLAGFGVLAFALIPPILIASGGGGAPPPEPVTAAERADLVASDDRWCNPALQFSLKNPRGGFEPNVEVAQEMNQQLARENDAMTAWVYSNNSGELAIVQAAKGMAHESETFEGFMHGLRESSVSAGALTVVDEKLTAGLPPYRYRLSANRPDGVAVDFYCASPAQEQGVAGLIVCVTTFAADHIELRGFRESVRFDSCT